MESKDVLLRERVEFVGKDYPYIHHIVLLNCQSALFRFCPASDAAIFQQRNQGRMNLGLGLVLPDRPHKSLQNEAELT